MQTLEMISALSNACGPSGFEDDALRAVRQFAPAGYALAGDALNNLYLRREKADGAKPVLQLDAHSDEVGFMVQAVRPNGTLRFIALGGWVNSNIPAHRVRVRTRFGTWIPGVVAAKPPHFMSEAEKGRTPEIEDMSIDIGASSAEEAIQDFGVRIGAPVAPDVQFSYDESHDLMFGKAFDNRLGCAAVLATLERLGMDELAVDPVGALAAQEEVGTRGAEVTARTVKPALAIAFEGSPADDTVVEPYLAQTAIHKGPMLRHIDKRMITSPRFQRYALDLAGELGIPAQESVRSGGSTDGAPIHLSNDGVPTIVIGLPVRYIHSHWGIASLSDFTHAVDLAEAVIRRLDAATIAAFRGGALA